MRPREYKTYKECCIPLLCQLDRSSFDSARITLVSVFGFAPPGFASVAPLTSDDVHIIDGLANLYEIRDRVKS